MIKKKEINIEWKKAHGGLNQGVNNGIEFALVTEDNKQIHQFVYCKDYLQDAVMGFLNNQQALIYGFNYNPKEHLPVCMSAMRVLVANRTKDEKYVNQIEACLDFINQIEVQLKMKRTVVYRCTHPLEAYKKSGTWLFEGSKRWMAAPPMISLYALLIRSGVSHTKGVNYKDTIEGIINGKIYVEYSYDKSYISSAKEPLERFIKHGDRKIFKAKEIKDNYPASLTVNDMHNRGGIVSYNSKSLQSKLPQWFREFPEKPTKKLTRRVFGVKPSSADNIVVEGITIDVEANKAAAVPALN